ncbi:MAG TPA: DJ-1/PfpI family protein, partial [Acidimicrobiales bacterium]|nr:DJ-1/PfpI family protein [Acidimicrobiales bacterium]
MRKSTARRRHTVAAVVSHQLSPFEFAVVCEVFGVDRSSLGVPWYRFVVCSADTSPLTTTIPGLTVAVPRGVGALRQADTIVVPVTGVRDTPNPDLIAALRRAHARGARILSLCTGAFILAAAGLLDDRPATTHWKYADELATRYPRVKVNPRVLYVDDGDVLTSAGSAAGIDLCLHVVRQDFGAEIANEVAR